MARSSSKKNSIGIRIRTQEFTKGFFAIPRRPNMTLKYSVTTNMRYDEKTHNDVKVKDERDAISDCFVSHVLLFKLVIQSPWPLYQ